MSDITDGLWIVFAARRGSDRGKQWFERLCASREIAEAWAAHFREQSSGYYDYYVEWYGIETSDPPERVQTNSER